MEGRMKSGYVGSGPRGKRSRLQKAQEYEAWLRSEEGEEVTYKKSLNVQTYVDIRALASLDRFLCDNGIVVRTISEILRELIQMTMVTIREEGVELETSVEAAAMYLEQRGFSMAQYEGSDKQRKRLGLALQAESYAYSFRKGTREVVTDTGGNPYYDLRNKELTLIGARELAERGYDWDRDVGDAQGSKLPPRVLEDLKKGKLPVAIGPAIKEDGSVGEFYIPPVPEMPLDRQETPEEACIRRDAEWARDQAIMKRDSYLRNKEKENA
jgi:hypothetical protein